MTDDYDVSKQMKNLSSNLKRIKNERGFNRLVDMSKYMGISVSYLFCLMNGKRVPSLQTLQKIADLFYDGSIDDLLRGG